ncbi:MAG: B12-binding domain-containing radical SAM protein [Candidatus Moranbacteria bacterium CG10_big_fil_rev_8_21_14_0_10_35_21]|nr:MAG: B12-binding domain-containing radical SAM protein [Candidatus Moranbacteria bacterium CG10_big_fil_rev_8_21_14_0_10_35_21]PJA89005.1 MAG: B12-binding domain-containing radical SAM protein [Candidatus Moranbacteria bacterium CG_4_9_14_3_um_filter_36_9]
MKISISYPPLESKKGTPCLTQNRQFQWFNAPTYIYPVIPAYAATLLKNNGYEVLWDDGIAEELTYNQWKERIIQEKPDIIAIETKTPVVEMHWKIINDLKNSKFEIRNSKFVLYGDHATALPQESLEKSKVDFVIQSGDYDFMLLNLANHLDKGVKLEGGFWFRSSCHPELDSGSNLNSGSEAGMTIISSGPSDLSKHNLDDLPMIDRKLTKWKNYAYKNGNFKHTPGAYMMSGRDCWWGKCSFCVWAQPGMFPGKNFRTRSAKNALDEVGQLIDLGVKEIMEDSGSLPIGQWLEEFCQGMITRGYSKKIVMSCNMRITGIKKLETWKLMKKAGFRFILFGLESANQETLDKICKNLKVEEIEPGLKLCKDGGLEPHITAMIGYPWETKEMAQKTIDLAKKLFSQGYVDTLQGTIVTPYPGTPLYKECQEKGWLVTQDYSHYDQRGQVMKSPLTDAEAKGLVQGLYKSFMTPKFILKKIMAIRSFDDIKYIFIGGMRVLGHLTDFSKK